MKNPKPEIPAGVSPAPVPSRLARLCQLVGYSYTALSQFLPKNLDRVDSLLDQALMREDTQPLPVVDVGATSAERELAMLVRHARGRLRVLGIEAQTAAAARDELAGALKAA